MNITMRIITIIFGISLGSPLFCCEDYNSPQTKLCHAIRTRNLLDVQTLLTDPEVQAVINKPADKDEPALHWAAILGDVDITRELLSHGADPRLPDKDGDTPMHSAAIGGSVEVGILLLASGAASTINAIDNHGYVPLHDAAFHGQSDFARFLLANGAKETLHHVAGNALTPHDAAIKNQHVAIARILEEAERPAPADGTSSAAASASASPESWLSFLASLFSKISHR